MAINSAKKKFPIVEQRSGIRCKDGVYSSWYEKILKACVPFGSYCAQLIHNVPIVLVKQSQSNHGFSIDYEYMGSHNSINIVVPDDHIRVRDYTKLLGKLEGDGCLSEEDLMHDPSEEVDIWGLYTKQNIFPLIFIWVDKIFNWCTKKSKYELYASNTILHEMMHALMDVDNCRNRINTVLYDWKEESLSEAGALVLMKGLWSDKNIDDLVTNIAGKAINYSLGAKYFKTSVKCVTNAVNCWYIQKYDLRYYGHQNYLDLIAVWMRYVIQPQKLNTGRLTDMDRALSNPQCWSFYKGQLLWHCHFGIILQEYVDIKCLTIDGLKSLCPEILYVVPQWRPKRLNYSHFGQIIHCQDGVIFAFGMIDLFDYYIQIMGLDGDVKPCY